MVVVRVDVPGRDAVRIPGYGQVTVSGRVDPLGRVLRVVVDGFVAGPGRVVHAQDGPEHASAGRVIVSDFRRPHVVGSCGRQSEGRIIQKKQTTAANDDAGKAAKVAAKKLLDYRFVCDISFGNAVA